MQVDAIDLHVHSNISDGTLSPKELVLYAKKNQLRAFALTDHDTIKGIAKAKEEGKNHNIEIISGIELSTFYQNTELHILGLFIDETNSYFLNKLEQFILEREKRNEKMIYLLNKLGINIRLEDVINVAKDAVITRAHIAKALYLKGFVKSFEEAFEKYIGNNCIAYVSREIITPKKAINLILKAGGIPILAHPFIYNFSQSQLKNVIDELTLLGLKGIEAIYSLHSPQEESFLKQIARNNELLISGGSDFHGTNKPFIDLGCGKGHLYIPYKYLDLMKKYLKRNFQPNC